MNFKVFFVALLGLCGILFFTNPKEENHREFIKEKFSTILKEKIDAETSKYDSKELSIIKDFGLNLIPAIGDKHLNNLAASHVKRKNYYIFSTTQVLYNNTWHIVGYGIFNKVKLFPKVEEELQKIDIKEEAIKLLNK